MFKNRNNLSGGLRFLAFLYKRYPCFALLPSLLAGQLLAICFDFVSLILAVIALATSWLLFRPVFRIGMGVLGGCVTMLLTMSHTDVDPKSGSFLVQAQDGFRYNIQGLVEFPAIILDSLDTSPVGQVPQEALTALCRGVNLPWRALSRINPGDRFVGQLRIKPILRSTGLLSRDAALRRRGYDVTCEILNVGGVMPGRPSVINRMREKIISDTVRLLGDKESTSVLLALTIGVRDRLSTRTEQAFKRSGLAHLLVVSGYQITVIAFLVMRFLRALFLKVNSISSYGYAMLFTWLGAAVVALLYALVVGLDGSSLRAIVAFAIVLTSYLLERRRGLFDSIALSLIVVMVIWPGSFLEPGVQLTFTALIGIALALREESEPLILQYLRVCFFASIASSIVILAWFRNLSVVGFLLNPLFGSIISIVGSQGGLLALGMYELGIDKAGYLLRFEGLVCDYIKDGIVRIASTDWAVWEPSPVGSVVAITCMLSALLWFAWKAIRLALIEHGVLRTSQSLGIEA